MAAWILLMPVYHKFVDLHVYLLGGNAIASGDQLYAVRGETGGWFTYPPFAAIAFWPLTLLSAGVMEWLWTALLVVVTSVACLTAVQRETRWWLAGLVGLLVPWTAVVFNSIRFGQIGMVLCLLVILDVWLIARGSRWGGGLIGLATAIKLTPGLFIVWLVLTGRYRAAGMAGVVFGVALLVGFVAAPSESTAYWTETLWATGRVGDVESARNLSLFGTLLRAGIPPLFAMVGQVVLGCVGMIAAVLLARRHNVVAGAYLVGVLTAVLSPIAWTHHFTWLILVLIAALGSTSVAIQFLSAACLLAVTTGIGVVSQGVVIQLLALVLIGAMAVVAFARSSSPSSFLPGAVSFAAR